MSLLLYYLGPQWPGVTLNGKRSQTRLARWELAALTAILLIAALTRTIGLGRVPPGLSADELVNSRMAERVINGERPIWFEESFGHEPLYHYAQAVTMQLVGVNVWGIVLPSVVAGVLTVWLAYALGRRAFSPAVGLIAAAGLAVTWWPVFFSRVGLRSIGLAPLATAAAYALWRGLEAAKYPELVEGRDSTKLVSFGVLRALFWFVLSGALLTAGLYTYSAAKALPFAFGAFVLYLVLVRREWLRGRWIALLLAAILAAGLYWPLYRYLQTHEASDSRTAQIAAPLEALKGGDPKPILENVMVTFGAFGFKGDPKWRHNIAGRPTFTPVGAVCFYGGLLLMLWRWQQPRNMLLLLWWASGLLPSITKLDAPSSNRMIASLVASSA